MALLQAIIDKSGRWKDIYSGYPMAMLKKSHKPEFKKLVITCPQEKMIAAGNKVAGTWVAFMPHIRAFLESHKNIKVLHGSAPPGDLERKLQTWLDRDLGAAKGRGKGSAMDDDDY